LRKGYLQVDQEYCADEYDIDETADRSVGKIHICIWRGPFKFCAISALFLAAEYKLD